MSKAIETVREIVAKMDDDKKRLFLGAAYEEIVGYNQFEDDPSISLEEGEKNIVGTIEEWEFQGEGESALHGLARAFMATRPDLRQMSLDEWLAEHHPLNTEDDNGEPTGHPLLTRQEHNAGSAILRLFPGYGG